MFRLLSLMIMPFCISANAAPAQCSAVTPFEIPMIFNNHTFTYSEKYIEPTDFTVYETIIKRRINSPIEEKMEMVDEYLRSGADYKTALLTCFPLLEKTVGDIQNKIYIAPKNSAISFYPQNDKPFVIKKEKAGRELDAAHAYREIYLFLKSKNRKFVKLQAVSIEPEITMEHNIAITNLKAEFSTDFSYSTPNRKDNIYRALQKLNGKIIEDGAILSFNKAVGPRTQANGFKEAKIIIGGKYTDGLGGGVCQVSTTLYNAAIRAGLECRARNHSILPSYVDPSFDAMVNSGSSDLILCNNTGEKVFLACHSDGSRAYIKIYGLKNPYKIVTQSCIINRKPAPPDEEIIDYEYEHFQSETALKGERKQISYAHDGLTSEGYLLYYDDYGRLVKKILLRRDVYIPVKGIIAVAP